MVLFLRRSPKWGPLRASHLRLEGWCRFCGGLVRLQVHHIIPVHVDPALELDPANLITLCENPGHNCHLLKGHLGDWSKWNPDIRALATIPDPNKKPAS